LVTQSVADLFAADEPEQVGNKYIEFRESSGAQTIRGISSEFLDE